MQITFLLTIPSIQNYSKDAQQLQQYDRVLQLRTKRATNKENIQNELKKLNTALVEKKQVFFTTKEVEEFTISRLPKIAERYGIKIQSLTFDKPFRIKNNVDRYSYSFSFISSK